MDIEALWTAVCSDDQDTVRAYFDDCGEVNRRINRFGANHSLIMGAMRNGHFAMVRMLLSYGETIEGYEESEYRSVIHEKGREYYKPEIARLKGHSLHLNMEFDGDRITSVSSPEYPDFHNVGIDTYDAYYALCEWLRQHPDTHKTA